MCLKASPVPAVPAVPSPKGGHGGPALRHMAAKAVVFVNLPLCEVGLAWMVVEVCNGPDGVYYEALLAVAHTAPRIGICEVRV